MLAQRSNTAQPTIKAQQVEQNVRAQYKYISSMRKPPNKGIQIFSKTGQQKKFHRCKIIVKEKTKPKAKFQKATYKKSKSSSDEEFCVKNQKKDRNVISNLVHHFIKFLVVSKGSEEFVRKTIQIRKLNFTFDDFLVQMKMLSKNLRTYVTFNHVNELWFSQKPQRKDLCTLMRILSRKFYAQCGFLSVYYSNKFNTNSKVVHMKGIRGLLEALVKKDNLLKINQFQNL